MGRETLQVVVKWPKNIRLQRNGNVSKEVAEHMTVIPVAVFLLLDPVDSLVSLVGNSAVGAQRWNLADVREHLNGTEHLFRNCTWSPFCSAFLTQCWIDTEKINMPLVASIDTHQSRSVVKLC